MARRFTEADAARVRAKQATALGLAAAPPSDTEGPGHNELRDACVTWLVNMGAAAWANDTGINPLTGKPYGTPGVPDILGWRTVDLEYYLCNMPQFLAVEIKVGRDTLSPLQETFLAKLNAAGGIGLVVRDSLEDLERQWKERMRC